MSVEPPPFQESARCDVCNCSFNTFRRRHHCRRCGRTLCHEHSSNQMALPQFGIYSNVRVCADCFNNSGPGKHDPQVSLDGTNNITNAISKLDIDTDVNSKTAQTADSKAAVGIKECKCGMPLCICEAPPAPSSDALPQQKITPAVAPPSNPKPKKSDVPPKSRTSTSNSKFSSFNLGRVSGGASDGSQMNYEATGEGLREAIKNGDAASVRKLLNQGVDANYKDKQGMSLLHLAAVFNQTDIVFILMDAGASLEYKNAQGETPLDCAPVTLQYKMRQKMEESKAMDVQKI